MPILAHEPDLFPEDLLEKETPSDLQWFAMYTLSRREKELMRQLRAKKIAHYGPLVEQRKRSPAGRIRTSYVPLFPGYVFVCGREQERYEAIASGCISKCLEITEPSQFVADLRRIRQLLIVGEDVRPEPKPLIGKAAIVKSGAMAGAKGIVTHSHSQHRLTILVKFMQQGASVVIDEADLEFVD